MYPIDFSETRKKNNVATAFKVPGYVWAIVLVPLALIGLFVCYLDYSAVAQADEVIEKMEVAMTGGGKRKSEIRMIAGISPDKSDPQGRQLHETYVFRRVIPVLPPRIATVISNSSGQVIDVLDTVETHAREAAKYN